MNDKKRQLSPPAVRRRYTSKAAQQRLWRQPAAYTRSLGSTVGVLTTLGLMTAACGASPTESEREREHSTATDPNRVAEGTPLAESVPAPQGEETAMQEPAPMLPLNSFETNGEYFQFSGVPTKAGMAVVISGRQSAFATSNLFVELTKQYPDLTPLEIFYALAPEGEEPHERLVANHQAEALAKGRPDAAINRVDFNPHQTIEKSAEPCKTDILTNAGNALNPGTWHNTDTSDYSSGENAYQSPYANQSPWDVVALVGVCNYSPGSITLKWKVQWNYAPTAWSNSFTLNSNWWWWGAKLKTSQSVGWGIAIVNAVHNSAITMLRSSGWD